MYQMAATQIHKDRVEHARGDRGDDAEERGPLELLGAREDGGGDERAELEGVLPCCFDGGEGPSVCGFNVLWVYSC